jgi:hypothetical protein
MQSFHPLPAASRANAAHALLALGLLTAAACASHPNPEDVPVPHDATSARDTSGDATSAPDGGLDAAVGDDASGDSATGDDAAMDASIGVDSRGPDAFADAGPDARADAPLDVRTDVLSDAPRGGDSGATDGGTIITGTTWYVDCASGSDAASGTSPTTEWRTLTRANAASLRPGDGLLFKRGCTWTGALHAAWSGTSTQPVVLGAYGSGANPVITFDAAGTATSGIPVTVTGSYEVIEGLTATLVNPRPDPACVQAGGAPLAVGWYVGFSVSGSHNVLRGVEAHDLALGVDFDDTSGFNQVFDSYFHDLNMLWQVSATVGALGALGVNLHGTHNEVGYCLFERNEAQCTLTGGSAQEYSAPFEVYNANGCYAHHNRAYGHRKHFEMGHDSTHTTDDNVLAYNLFVSDHANAVGPNIHSGPPYGPVNRTQIYNNTIVFTGANSQGIVSGGDGATIRNNIFVAEWKSAYYDGTFVEDHNLYWDLRQTTDTTPDPFVQFASGASPSALSATSILVDPRFVSSVVPGGDYHLASTSPAIDVGGTVTTSDPVLLRILAEDLDHAAAPQGAAYDLGGYELAH